MTPTRWTPRDAGGEATIATWNDEPEDEEEEENETAAAAESSSSSDDDDAGMRVAALPADGDPDFDSGPPMDGLEYLRRVRHEAKQVPDVMVSSSMPPESRSRSSTSTSASASLDRRRELAAASASRKGSQLSRAQRNAACVPAPPHAIMDRAWRDAFLADFSDVRAAMTRAMARLGNDGGGGDGARAAAAAATNASDAALAGEDDDDEDGSGDGHSPLWFARESLLLEIDDLTSAALLREHARAIEASVDDDDDDDDGDRDGSSPEPSPISFSRRRAAWFFALSARVGLPLDAETSAAIRAAAKALSKLRASTRRATDPSLPRLQVCYAIAGRYFGQGEPE